MGRKKVQSHINWYKRNPKHVGKSCSASQTLFAIYRRTKKNRLALEFSLLPIIESAFDPFAYSHGRASGLWQFIPATGRLYGLEIDWWFDARRDIRASTQAAIRYLKRLNKLFGGDWLLTLAAYNAGEGNILKSIRKSGIDREQVEFWQLKVLSETSHTFRDSSNKRSHLQAFRIWDYTPDIPDEPYWGVVDT